MLPVSSDALAWIAGELSLVVLEDGENGAVRALSGAVPEPGLTLEAAAARLAARDADDAQIAMLIASARAGDAGTLEIGGELPARIFAWSERPGRARVLFAPRPEAIARRAAAADLAAGVTHEVANALTAIAGWTRMAASGGPLPERTRHALDVVQRSARDALGTARGLLSTMRDAGRTVVASAPEQTDVGLVVEEVIETLRPELAEAGIALDIELDEQAWGTTAPSALRLIVSNLVRNAFEALDRGGRIRVGVRAADDRICVTIADDGPGMSAETLGRAFDRYFTTKANGTGLGLALVRDTVDEAGGHLDVESRRGGGTRFHVWLPAAGSPSLSARPPQVTTMSSGVHPRPALVDCAVLVVDDDEALRSLVRTALELQGARVYTACDIEEALAIEASFRLALVDLSLGEARGDELLRLLRAEGRVERAILLTGSPDVQLAPAGAPDAVIRKPFELEELTRVIHVVLAGNALVAKA